MRKRIVSFIAAIGLCVLIALFSALMILMLPVEALIFGFDYFDGGVSEDDSLPESIKFVARTYDRLLGTRGT